MIIYIHIYIYVSVCVIQDEEQRTVPHHIDIDFA